MTLGSPILRTVAQFAIPLTGLISAMIFFQGHNLPGGGFIAGVLGAAAGATWLLAYGIEEAGRFDWWRLSVTGLGIALLTGTAPFALGGSFMDHTVWDVAVPLFGHVHFPTATFFDLGVYLIVLGTLMTIFIELGSERR